MTYLSRLASLGLAKETTQGTYVVPTDSLPFNTAKFTDTIEPLRDESVRSNDAVLQGLYQGTWTSSWEIELNSYGDICGHFLRALIGPDTPTAGVSTTLSSSTTVGATSINSTATIPVGSTIMIDTGVKIEYAVTGTPSGSGPYTIPITTPGTGLTIAHSSGQAVVSQTTHTFAQARTSSTVWPSYSLTVNDVVETRGFPGQVFSDLALKIDPKSIVTMSPKSLGWPSAIQSTFTPAYSTAQPSRGWTWTMTNGGGASTRGLTFDMTMKRATEAIHASNGQQGPREVFPGALEVEGTYKAIFESVADYQLYYSYLQEPCVATLTEPVGGQLGAGTVLALTMSKSGWTTFDPDLAAAYVQASFNLSGVANSIDNGVTGAVLKNFRTTTY